MTGPLKNPKHERFAQELAKGKGQAEAYAAAGYRGDRPHASRLATNGNISARVDELLSRAAKRTEITVASITERLIGIAEKGEALTDASGLSVARASLMDAAKLNGLVIDRTQRELSEEQMKAVLDTIAANPGMAKQLLAQMG